MLPKQNPTLLYLITILYSRGLLGEFTRAYQVLNTHLKGLHITVDLLTPYHNKWGWDMHGRGLLEDTLKEKLWDWKNERVHNLWCL